MGPYDLPKRRGDNVPQRVQNDLNSLALLSESLRLLCADHGAYPAMLGREDITAFLKRLAYLTQEGTISAYKRLRTCRDVRLVLSRMRALGLNWPGKPLHGLADDFALGPYDIPNEVEDTETGRDLPVEVMRYLCEHLDELEEISVELRAAVELIIDTSRRQPHQLSRPPASQAALRALRARSPGWHERRRSPCGRDRGRAE
ncbi:hypothetical protein ACQEVF_49810 [Nonomuraea polychroma]|uniref:hypothetical protein n=1 Tax=Nonomuraea polychroma TaxID=46176 RepID=UPI003D90981B